MINHVPVLLNEVLEYLDPKPGQKFIDATAGGGGHAFALVEKIKPDGKLLAVEWDEKIFSNLEADPRYLRNRKNIVLVNSSYVNLGTIAKTEGFMESDGVLFDLGLSSWQLGESGRGFSFQKEELIDMRFSVKERLTAGEIVNKFSPDRLAEILRDYGEERFARKIAAIIARERKRKEIETTGQLVEIIKQALPSRYRHQKIHFATRTFQALRIAVNDELNNIQIGLEQAVEIMKTGSRLAVISFHSLEDRIVKLFFRESKDKGLLRILTKKPLTAARQEILNNPRARSAKLRLAEKI